MLQLKQQILAGFKNCGYKNDLLREDYIYFDGKESKTAEIVGFSQPTYNSSTACIAAIDKTKLNGKKISSYQSLGCPVLLVCDDRNLQFWKNDGANVVVHEEVDTRNVTGFFKKYEKDFSPQSIYEAKTIGRVKKEYQLSFADIGGLMGIVEKKEGEYLSELTERIIVSLKTNCTNVKEDSTFNKWLFQAAFWLIGAKILADKKVERFKNLKISNIDDLVERVKRHYNASKSLDITNVIQKKAFEKVAKEIVEPVSSFSHLTIESLAYVYENTLTSKDTRKVLGTHATPSWLVNYMVWELIDWIEAIPQANRIILEPACGHAPFLTAGAKLLSSPLVYNGKEEDRHKYLKDHLIGIDKDNFAEEIARLALTLADIPNPNGWNIQHSDIYEANILKKAAQKATILFCNPPFENFSPKKKKQRYGNTIITGNKAAEILAKTLPYMPPNSVFGIILPRGFLHKKNLADLRKYVLDNFELRTICNLPDNVFAKAGHLSTVLLGRKIKSKKKITYLNITKANLESFKNTYQADEELVNKDIFYKAENYDLRILELKEIWDYCKEYPKFREYAIIGRGIEYKDFEKSVRKEKFPGAVKGYASFETFTKDKKQKKVDINITKLPDYYWMSLNATEICNPRYGTQRGLAQIIASYMRSSRSVWRIEGVIDLAGDPISNKLISIRPIPHKGISVYIIWALVNSPFTNAYMHCHCMRQNLEGVLRDMPTPFDNQDLSKLESMVKAYFKLSEQHINVALIDESKLNEEKKQCLLAIDSEIMRLYRLPPRLEKRLLDFFAGVPRKGVDFKFDRYYPAGFDSYIPLHIFISKEFENSTVENVAKWIEKNRTPEVIEALKKAEEDYKIE